MLTGGVAPRKQEGKAGKEVRVADVSDLSLRSVKGTPGAAAVIAPPATEPEPES